MLAVHREVLNTIRQTQGLSPAALAARAGLSRSTVYNITNGYRTTMTPEVARRVARVLGVEVRVIGGQLGQRAS